MRAAVGARIPLKLETKVLVDGPDAAVVTVEGPLKELVKPPKAPSAVDKVAVVPVPIVVLAANPAALSLSSSVDMSPADLHSTTGGSPNNFNNYSSAFSEARDAKL